MTTHYHSDEFGSYLVSDMIRICKDKPIIIVPRDQLEFNMSEYCWDDGDERMSPIDMIERYRQYPELYTEHMHRISNADLSYPVIITSDYCVRDGMHRLCKYYKVESEVVKCVMITREELNSVIQQL